jgi:glycosyltransferase involved in cell wall biosynthesis
MRPILVCGLSHVSNKIGRHYKLLGEMLNARVVLYTSDGSGLSQSVAARFENEWRKATAGRVRGALEFLRLLLELRPVHIELYHDSPVNAHIAYVVFAALLRIPLVLVCRGDELRLWDVHIPRQRISYFIGLKQAMLVLYKHLDMPVILRRLRIPESKTMFFFNRIPLSEKEPKLMSERRGVLFLNSWGEVRHPEIAVEVGLRLADKYPETRFIIGGERYWVNDANSRFDFQPAIDKAGLQGRVELLSWTGEPEKLFAKCSVFLLPSEMVFLNYSLLEAMERGLVPVIADVEGANRIITHGKDGFIVELNVEAFTEAVDYLLSHPEKAQQMARSARNTVRERFCLYDGLKELIEVYRSKVW